MFKNKMAGMLQKAQQMQENIKQAQQEIKALEAVGVDNVDSVSVTMNGEYKATSISIQNDLMNDKETLEDLMLVAINDASDKIKQAVEDKMRQATGGIDMPNGINLPF